MIPFIFTLLVLCSTSNTHNNDELQNKTIEFKCDYLNETPPNNIPKIFSKGFISTGKEICFEINRNGKEIIMDRDGVVLITKKSGNKWSDLFIAPFSGKVVEGECCFSPSGDKIYFASRKSLPGAKGTLNTWISEKNGDSWGKPYALKSPVWDQNSHAVSVTNSGNIYCSGVNVFYFSNGKYSMQTPLSSNVKGTHPFVAPDESYIIFGKRADGRWDKDLFISFNNHGSWSDPISLNNKINTKSKESNPFVTPDGKYLFFTRSNNVYWVQFDFVNKLKSDVLK